MVATPIWSSLEHSNITELFSIQNLYFKYVWNIWVFEERAVTFPADILPLTVLVCFPFNLPSFRIICATICLDLVICWKNSTVFEIKTNPTTLSIICLEAAWIVKLSDINCFKITIVWWSGYVNFFTDVSVGICQKILNDAVKVALSVWQKKFHICC